MLRNNIFGITGSNFESDSGVGSNQESSVASLLHPITRASTGDQKANHAAGHMQHVFLNELKIARDSSLSEKYSLSVQKYKRVIKMIENFNANGSAPPMIPKWRILLKQLQAEMAMVIELD